MNTLINKRVYVGKFSEEIQRKAFKLGFVWNCTHGEKQRPKSLDVPFLFFNSNGNLSNAFDLEYFNNHDFEEVTPEWILNLPEKVDKSWSRLNSKIVGFEVFESDITPVSVTDISSPEEPDEFDIFNTLPSEEEAKAYRVLPKLLYWRNFYNEGWKPNWEINIYKYTIVVIGDNLSVSYTQRCSSLFAFKNAEIRDRFLEDFKEELEIVKPLL